MTRILRSIPLAILLMLLLIAIACKQSTQAEYSIDSSVCNGCGECIRVCPNDAIHYDLNNKAVIDQTKCQQCGKCVLACPNNAIH